MARNVDLDDALTNTTDLLRATEERMVAALGPLGTLGSALLNGKVPIEAEQFASEATLELSAGLFTLRSALRELGNAKDSEAEATE